MKFIKDNKAAYLSKRIVARALKHAFKNAADETMAVMGYNVIAFDGWIVKKFDDGSIEKIEPIASGAGRVNLD